LSAETARHRELAELSDTEEDGLVHSFSGFIVSIET